VGGSAVVVQPDGKLLILGSLVDDDAEGVVLVRMGYSELIRVKATCHLAEPNLMSMRSSHCWCGKQASSTGGPTGA